jgi:carbamoyltransferase
MPRPYSGERAFMNKTILGITDGDDGGAVLVVDGRMVAAVNEERLNRMKMSIGFPRQSVQEVLRLAGKTPEQVDEVAMASYTEHFYPEPHANKGWFQESSAVARIRNDVSSALAKPLGDFQFARKTYQKLKRLTMGRRRAGVRKILAELGVNAPIGYHDHHRCHVVAAFDTSGFDEALSISLDGGGDGQSCQILEADQSREALRHRLDSFDSIGNYYAYVTHLCGFRASIHEGKITGLAAHGEPRYLDLFRSLVDYRDGEIRNVGKLFFRSAIQELRDRLPSDWEHEDLAASVQAHLEEVVVAFVRHWLRETGKTKVCLSGGVFANVKLNQRLAELPECEAVYVFPAMGDGGLAAGAAFSAWRAHNGFHGPLEHGSPMPHAYLGSSFDEAEMEAALRRSGEPYRRYDDIADVIAHLVHEGKVVARFDGPMEYGPRALGNRTILYRTSEKAVNDWLNKRLNRTEFMPFAPACLAGHEDQMFRWNPAAARAARFMTITLDCTPWMQEHCPAVVHIDGTARPQIVDRETNPGFHEILSRYHRLSGVPCVVNTSFNMHEEPIVRSPEDAVRSYQQGKLDNLAVGPFLLGQPPARHGREG